jgi:predicted nucleic acid-binding protein
VISAVDTNVLLDVFGADPAFGRVSADALRQALAEGALIACPVVWAEVATTFTDTQTAINAMDSLGVSFSAFDRGCALLASTQWHAHRAAGGRRNRIAADFLIGAHSIVFADRLLTRDQGFFRPYFGEVRIVDPTDRSN